MKRLLPTVFVATFLVGCAVGPDYSRPTIATPDRFRGQPDPTDAGSRGTVTDGPTSLADRAWWDLFQDDVLRSLIDEALKNGYDVRLAAWRVEEARAAAGVARSEYYPQVAGSAGWWRAESDFLSPVDGTFETYDVRVRLSWELDLWGRIRRLNEAALARYLATEEARRGVLLGLVTEVATTYFELRALDARLDIARRTAVAFEETHTLFGDRQTAGLASALETSSAQASLDATAATIPDLERRIVALENRLAFLLGRSPDDLPRGAALDDQPLPPEVPAGLPSTLLERRPDVRQAEQELIAASADVGVAVANRFPTLRLTTFFGALAPEVSALFPDGRTWSVGGGLLTPVFQGKRLDREQRAAVARQEQARLAYERSVTNAFAEVSTAIVAYHNLAEVESRQARAVEAYRQASELVNTRYASGLADYLEVLQAQRQLFPAENTLIVTRQERLATLMTLYRALGGGWRLPADDWTLQAGIAGTR